MIVSGHGSPLFKDDDKMYLKRCHGSSQFQGLLCSPIVFAAFLHLSLVTHYPSGIHVNYHVRKECIPERISLGFAVKAHGLIPCTRILRSLHCGLQGP